MLTDKPDFCSGTGGATVTEPVGGYVDGLVLDTGVIPLEHFVCAGGQCGGPHKDAIIGGVVGAGIIALGLVGLCLWRIRRRSVDTSVPEEIEPQMQELADPGPELQSREDAMLTSAFELPHPPPELQSREDGMQTSAHELPGSLGPGTAECQDSSSIHYRY